jgi:glycosyltransferase involved in cell wall biosynthesis
MRILYFHQYFSTPAGSSGTRSYELARRLISRGHRVTIVTGMHPGSGFQLADTPNGGIRTGCIDGIHIVQICLPYSNHDGIAKRAWTFLRFAWRSIGVAFREPADLVFATSTPLTAAIPGMLAKLVRRKPFVFEVRDLWPELPKAMGVVRNPLALWSLSLLEWAAYKSADGLIGLSPGIVSGIQRIVRETKPVVLIPNACDTDLFYPRPTVNEGSHPLKAVFMGAHGQANGLDAILDAAVLLKQRNRLDIHIHLIGDGRLKPALMKRAQREELYNCAFMEPMPKRHLAKALSAADVGLMLLANVPAFYDGTSPNKFFDYLAAGLPVINNYPGWVARLIEEHACGFAVNPEDPEALADALSWMADHPANRKKMGEHARKLAETSFSRDKLGHEFAEFLESICGNAC